MLKCPKNLVKWAIGQVFSKTAKCPIGYPAFLPLNHGELKYFARASHAKCTPIGADRGLKTAIFA